MSERAASTLPKGVPKRRAGSVHEAVIAMIREIVREEVEPRLPVTGTVVGGGGRGGGAQRVHIDDEEDPREDGFVRKLGQRYRAGDRVLLVPTKSGHMVVAGSISDTEGNKEQVVGEDDVVDDAITDKKLKRNSVTGGANGAIANGAVDTGNLKDKSVTGGKIAKNAVGPDELNTSLNSKINGALQPSDVQGQGKVASTGYVDDKVPDTGDFVEEKDLAPGAIGNAKLATEAWVRKYFEEKK